MYISNMWPALSILMQKCHPSEISKDDYEDGTGRMGLAIGIVSSTVNASTAISGLIVGNFLDSIKTPQIEIVSMISMTGAQVKYIHESEADNAQAIIDTMWTMMSLNAAGLLILIIWQFVSNSSLNR